MVSLQNCCKNCRREQHFSSHPPCSTYSVIQSVASNWQLSSYNHQFFSYLLVHDTKVNALFVAPGSTETLNRVVIVAPPQNATVVLGRPAVMECMAQGQPKPLVSWSRQGKRSNSPLFCWWFSSCLLFFFSTPSVALSLSTSLTPRISQTQRTSMSGAELHTCSSEVTIFTDEVLPLLHQTSVVLLCTEPGST